MIAININSGGLWFLFGIFFFGCLTFSVQSVMRWARWQPGIRPRVPGFGIPVERSTQFNKEV